MVRLLRRLLLVMLLCVPAAAGAAAPARNVVEIAGKLLPLPPGDWTPVAETIERRGGDAFAAVALARIDGKVVDGLVIARANLVARPMPLAAAPECTRTDIHLAHVAYDTAVDGVCLFLNHVVLAETVAGPVVWLMARERLAALGATLPDTWLVAGVRARTGSHAIEARYYFAPPDHRSALPSLGWAASRWSAQRVAGDPDRRSSIRRLTVWTMWTREAVELGLRGQVPDDALPPAPWDGPDLARRWTERRVERLVRLRQEGAIDDDSFRHQRRLIEATASDLPASQPPLWQDGMWRRIGHRVASVAESLGLSYAVLGGLWPSLGFAVLVDVLSPVGAYLQSTLWPGAAANAGDLPVAFAEIGQSGP